MASTPRGLLNFIRDIRNCANKEDEKKRVNVELANIRTKFKSEKLSPYERKKCAPCRSPRRSRRRSRRQARRAACTTQPR